MNRLLGVLLFCFLTAGSIAACPADSMARDLQGVPVVIIDPAHGGEERGVVLEEKRFEKDVTLAIAKDVQKYLDESGKIKAELTRSSDRSVSFSERVKRTTDARADLFISIHVNAGFGKKASGYEAYFPGFKSSAVEGSGSSEIVRDMVRTQHLNESVRLARLMLKQMEKVFPRKDRGLREAPIRIVQELSIPAVVIETGFATEARDRNDLLDPSKQNAVAVAIGKSILEYFAK